LLIRHVIFVGWLPIDVKKEHPASVVDRGDVDYKVECPAWHSSEASGTSGEAILECPATFVPVEKRRNWNKRSCE
jgi:hypothetical protein